VSRVQLALNVSDLDEAVDFYSKLFNVSPAKLMARYANFSITQPPLKLVLIQSSAPRESGIGGALNHLGVEVESSNEVSLAIDELSHQGLDVCVEESVTCCHAVQDKVWVHDPDGAPWEIYTVLADAPESSGPLGDGACCSSDEKTEHDRSETKAQRACC